MAKNLPPKKRAKRAKKRASANTPTREAILKFVAENPQRTSKRDIAKAFNIKGNAKIELKAVLRDLIDEGLIERRGKRLAEPGALPPVGVIDIVTRDREGGLLGIPANWDESASGKPPVIEVSRSGGKGRPAGVGERVLARMTRLGNSNRYSAKPIKII